MAQTEQESNTFTFIESRSGAGKYIRNLPTAKLMKLGCTNSPTIWNLIRESGQPIPSKQEHIREVLESNLRDIEACEVVLCLVRDKKIWGTLFATNIGAGTYDISVASSTSGGCAALLKELRSRHPSARFLAKVDPTNEKSVASAMAHCDVVLSNFCHHIVRANPPGTFPPAFGVLKGPGFVTTPAKLLPQYDEFALMLVKTMQVTA